MVHRKQMESRDGVKPWQQWAHGRGRLRHNDTKPGVDLGENLKKSARVPPF